MINPNDTKLLKDFLDYLGERNYTIIQNSFFKQSKSWYNDSPKKGDKVMLNVNFKAEIPSEGDIDDRIEIFLKNR
jgi:hypothetical protein